MDLIVIFSPMFWADGLRGAVISVLPWCGAVLGFGFAVTLIAAYWPRAH